MVKFLRILLASAPLIFSLGCVSGVSHFSLEEVDSPLGSGSGGGIPGMPSKAFVSSTSSGSTVVSSDDYTFFITISPFLQSTLSGGDYKFGNPLMEVGIEKVRNIQKGN